MARVEAALARLGVRDQADVEKMKCVPALFFYACLDLWFARRGMLVAVARRRAAARQTSSEVDESRLSAMHAANEEQRHAVQTKINRAVALGWVCEGYIDLVS